MIDESRPVRCSLYTILLLVPQVEDPTVSMTFKVNTSPFAGKEGKFVTSRNLKDRLDRELERNLVRAPLIVLTPLSYTLAVYFCGFFDFLDSFGCPRNLKDSLDNELQRNRVRAPLQRLSSLILGVFVLHLCASLDCLDSFCF